MTIDEAIRLCEKCISGEATYDEVTQYFDEIETTEKILALLRFVQAWDEWNRTACLTGVSGAVAEENVVVAARAAVDEALK